MISLKKFCFWVMLMRWKPSFLATAPNGVICSYCNISSMWRKPAAMTLFMVLRGFLMFSGVARGMTGSKVCLVATPIITHRAMATTPSLIPTAATALYFQISILPTLRSRALRLISSSQLKQLEKSLLLRASISAMADNMRP